MFQFLGLVAIGYLSLKFFTRTPLEPEPLDMDDFEFECERENDLIVGRIVRIPVPTSSDSESQQDEENDEEERTSTEEEGDDEASSVAGGESQEEESGDDAKDEESSYEMVEESAPADETSNETSNENSQEDQEEASAEEIEEEIEEIEEEPTEELEEEPTEEPEEEASAEESESEHESEHDGEVIWETVKGKGLQTFWHDVRKDLTPRELDVARLVMRRLRKNLRWGCLDTLWWIVLGRQAPMDLLTPKICSRRVRMRFYAPWVIQNGEDYAPSELDFTRSIRRWTR
tara:strand:+ start:701 stop:1564 length:864 start_codon:yes stop_codon:yes gene_type:complete